LLHYERPQRWYPSLLQLKGDLYRAQGIVEQAQVCYEQQAAKDSLTDQFRGLLSLAGLSCEQGKMEQGYSYAQQALGYWFDCTDPIERLYAVDGTYLDLEIAPDTFHPIGHVCRKLLEDGMHLASPLKGQMMYLLYFYTERSIKKLDPIEVQESYTSHLLEEAYQHFDHPLMCDDLARLFLSRHDWPAAIDYHLRYYEYLVTLEDAWEDFEDFYTAIQVETGDQRRSIHTVAFGRLQSCQNPSLTRSVYRPFFNDFWRALLEEEDMRQEFIDVTKMLAESSEDGDVIWFDYAWGLNEGGKSHEAELIYRRYLEHHPDDADALHNLSLILEEQGLFQESLLLSNKAAAHAPNNEIIVTRNTRLTQEDEKRRQIRQQEETQQGAQYWSALSDSQKYLLCLMALYPSHHWSALLTHLKSDEKLVRQVQEDWEGLLAQEFCAQSGPDAPMHAIALLNPFVCTEGFRLWLVAEVARVQIRKKKNLWLPQADDLRDERLAQLPSAQREVLHQALMRKIGDISPQGLEHLYLPFYRRVWKARLLEWRMHAALVDLCRVFLGRLSVMTREELWEGAYYATDLSDPQYAVLAEKWYEQYLVQGESHAAYHNLSVIYFRRNQYQDALQMVECALSLAPMESGSSKLKDSIEQAIREAEKRRQQAEREQQQQQALRAQYFQDLEKNIIAHVGEVDFYKQKILQALSSGFAHYSQRSLAKELRMEDWALKGHWKKLVSWGMILEEGRRTPALHPLVQSYLEKGWPTPLAPSIRTVVINPTSGSLTKPVFGSKQEYKLYTVLLEIFHGQLVFPNMALQAIFPYQKMKEVLTKEEFSYYMVSHVDICITRTTSYFPLIAFEVDGPHHEDEERQRKDALKNAIFEKGGLGLIRLQIGYQPLSAKEIWENVRAKIQQALYAWRSDSTRKGWIEDLETELGMSRFGGDAAEDFDLPQSEHQDEEQQEKEE